MSGVEILNQTNVYQTDGNGLVFLSILGVFFLIGLILAIKTWCDFGFDIDVIGVLVVFTAIGAVVGGFIFLGTVHETDKLDYVKYQVTISDEVSLNDFLEKYEILDQDGKIYAVKEK